MIAAGSPGGLRRHSSLLRLIDFIDSFARERTAGCWQNGFVDKKYKLASYGFGSGKA
jgi:hypothetical protein